MRHEDPRHMGLGKTRASPIALQSRGHGRPGRKAAARPHPAQRALALALILYAAAGALLAGCGSDRGLASIGEVPGDDRNRQAFIDWAGLRNPVLSDDSVSLKDPCVVYRDGTFYVFTSGASYRTKDFKRYEGPFEGYGSPDITRLGHDSYIMVYQVKDTEHPGPAAGVDPDSPDNLYRRLFYKTSPDLEHWSEGDDLFPALPPDRNIDGALALQGDRFYLGFKKGATVQEFRVARSIEASIDGRWTDPQKAHAGEGCLLDKLIPIIGDTITRWAENYQFIRIDGTWRMIATARDPARPIDFGYMRSHEPFIYRLGGPEDSLESWTNWVDKTQLMVPYEDWNTLMHANSAYLCDWRDHDGYFYLFYAGTNQETEDGRGHGRIGVVRSKDLADWRLPGDTGS
jgi:hypothetical protein